MLIRLAKINKYSQECTEMWTQSFWWRCKSVQPLKTVIWQHFERLNIHIVCDTEVPLLGISPVTHDMYKDIHCYDENNVKDHWDCLVMQGSGNKLFVSAMY